MAEIKGVSFSYQATNAQVTGDNAEPQPTLDTILAKFSGTTTVPAVGDKLKFYVNYQNQGASSASPLSWNYTVQTDDDFITDGVSFTVDPLLAMASTTTFTDGKVYDGAIWHF